MKKFKMALLLSVFLFVAAPLYAQTTILITPFDNATGDNEFSSLEKGIPDLLTAFFTTFAEDIAIIDREAMEGLFAEKSLSWEGFTGDDSYRELGRLSQAQYILRGSYRKTKKGIEINAFLHDSETTELLLSTGNEMSLSDLSSACQDLAMRISAQLKKPMKVASYLPTDEDPENNTNMIFGLGYYNNGVYEKAITHFMKILENNEQHEDARYWLAMSFQGAKLVDHAKIEFEKFLEMFPNGNRTQAVKKILEVQDEK